MLKIVVGASSFGKASQKPIELLQKHNIEVILNPYGRKLTEKETINFLQDADGILAGLEPLHRNVLLHHKGKLKAIARIGIGMDNVDEEAAREFSINVSRTPDGPTAAVAELTITALLALCRGILQSNTNIHKGLWKKSMGVSIVGLRVLIIGYGRIGRTVEKLLNLLGANTSIYDPLFPEISIPSLSDALANADVVSLHASGTSEIITEKEINLLPQGAFILNAARGTLVNEQALYNALQSGKIAGCWCDVYSVEPYNGILCGCENALLTPHISTYTTRCRLEMEMQAVNNILRDLYVI